VSASYALRDGEHWWFYLGSSGGEPEIALEIEGVMTWTPLVEGEVHGWYRTPVGHPVPANPNDVRLAVLKRPGDRLAHYARTVDVVDEETYPPTLTPDEYHAKIKPAYPDEDDEDVLIVPADDRVRALYTPVYEPTPPTRKPLEHDEWLVLTGAPAPKDGLAWTAALPHMLREHGEYRHLFPGHLAGFREALAARLNEIPGVNAYGSSHPVRREDRGDGCAYLPALRRARLG
jgi:hypothetical protein